MPRVFIGFLEVAGYYTGLKKGLLDLGCSVSFVESRPHRFGYRTGSNESEIEKAAYDRFFSAHSDSEKRERALHDLIERHDVFIFTSGASFPGEPCHWALPVLKDAGRQVIFVFTGSESRPPYLSRKGYSTREGGPVELDTLFGWTKAMRENLAKIEDYADAIICNPLTAQFQTRPFINFLEIGNPSWSSLDAGERVSLNESNDTGAWRLFHAPSWPEMKGSSLIREAVARIKAEGFDVEFTEMAGRPNREVLRQLRRTDLVIDQVYSDIPLASLGCEAAALGIPALTGGYGWDELSRITRVESIPPAFLAHPDDFAGALREVLAGGKDAARKAGENARAFLRRSWAPRRVAEKLLQTVDSRLPPEWVVEPAECSYALGVGVSKSEVREMVSALTEAMGIESLCLDDRLEVLGQLHEMLSEPAGSAESRAKCLLMTVHEKHVEAIRLREQIRDLKLKLAARNEKVRDLRAKLEKERAEARRRSWRGRWRKLTQRLRFRRADDR